ncbi:MAG: Nramp family divalent metal transporter, partial [Bdellovibrionales bacterium]|nr:Nramp family divalent metal transporter [Bdellovibrionales bacterium]
MHQLRKFQSILGPGILMAAAAIGVSHLVQSTRAGANFGFDLIILILLANFFKYPFFEYGHRYFVATGETLLSGYKRLGKRYLYAFMILNFFTAMASVAAVTFVTAALCQNLFQWGLSLPLWCFLLILISVLLLAIGHYRGLDIFIKILMVILLVATIAAFIAAMSADVRPRNIIEPLSPWRWANLSFFLALMGWMPAPIELSVWQSLWMEAKDRNAGRRTTLREAKIDFNFGYIVTVILAVIFCCLGAQIMFQSGVSFSPSPATFAGQVIELYTTALGPWSTPIISVAAIATMFSTTITLIDAYPRSIAEGLLLAFPKMNKISHRQWLNTWIFINCAIALGIIWLLQEQLKLMVDIVTIIAFIAGPFFAYINFKLIRSHLVSKNFQPGPALVLLSYLGLIFLCGFTILYIYKSIV